jgi:hypothetical protein
MLTYAEHLVRGKVNKAERLYKRLLADGTNDINALTAYALVQKTNYYDILEPLRHTTQRPTTGLRELPASRKAASLLANGALKAYYRALKSYY